MFKDWNVILFRGLSMLSSMLQQRGTLVNYTLIFF